MIRGLFAAVLLTGLPSAGILAQDAQPPVPAEIVPEQDEDVMKPTLVGVRFTPRIAEAMSRKFIEQMTPKYDLDDQQAEKIQDIMRRRLLKFAQDNAERGRDMIELMMATMIENDGRFPREQAQEFARLAQPFVPKLREFFTQTSGEIGQQMTLRQRMKFTGDVSVAAAGLTIFENRMKRWEEGRIGDFANPFFDPADNDPAKAQPTPQDPGEHADHKRARLQVEIGERDTKLDEQWEGYVNQAVAFYALDERQTAAARAILKDCQDRARALKTPQWKESVKQNRIARRLTRMSVEQFADGPWIYSLDREYRKLRQPLVDLDEELKRRIEELPTSEQRAAAREKVRQALAKRGLKQLPT